MSVLSSQGTQAPAPPPPPVPAMPTRPGQATATGAAAAAEGAATEAQRVRDEVREVLRGVREGVIADQNAALQGEAITLQPPPYRQESPIPPEVIPIVQTVFGSLIAIVLGYPIIRFVTRMIEKRSDRSMVRGAEVARQMQQLQQSLDAMAVEIERIGEAQRFQAKLLAERERAALPADRDSR